MSYHKYYPTSGVNFGHGSYKEIEVVYYVYPSTLSEGPTRSNTPSERNKSTANLNEEHQTGFVDTMKTFPWPFYKDAIESYNTPEIKRHSTNLLLKLVSFLNRVPTVPANKSCVAPSFKVPAVPENFVCKPLEKQEPRKVGILWQFGFDVDALEIHFHELDGLVDKYFILESTQAHSPFTSRKPLVWEMIKDDARFVQFSDKVVHFVVDDASLAKVEKKDIWARESQQESLRWTKFLEWNNATNYFGEEDVLGFGDVDEVPNRDAIVFLKNCQFPNSSIDIGIWFPFTGTNTVFSTDFPVRGHPFTLGDPTFWTLNSAKNYYRSSAKTPSRMRGRSSRYLLGGMHLSRYAFPPFQMTKMLTASEAGMGNLKKIVEIGELYAHGKEKEADAILNSVPESMLKRKRILDLESFREANEREAEAIVKIPWFLKCNRGRYPGFDNEHDSRLDRL